MDNTSNQKVAYWCSLAESNLETAEILFNNSKYLDAGFYCHQTLEKIFKAYYWSVKKHEPPYTHNLFLLADETDIQHIAPPFLMPLLAQVNPLNIEGRYPDEQVSLESEISLDEWTSLLEQTKEAVVWIKPLLKM